MHRAAYRTPTTLAVSLSACVSALAAGASTQPAEVELVRNGMTAWRLAIASDAGAAETFAVDELRRYIELMAGVRMALVPPTETKHVVRMRVLPDWPEQKRYDGYRVTITPESIEIAGQNTRGVLYGVYDLLEHLGCRWFYPTQDPEDPEVVPISRTLKLPAGSWQYASPMKYRICNGDGWFFKMDPAIAIKQADWAAKCRYNAMGWQGETDRPLIEQYEGLKNAGVFAELDKRGLMLHGPAHSFNLLLSHKEYMATHPDWFGMRDGKRVPQTFAGAQFCWSNADARKQFVANVEAFVKAAPQLKVLCIVPFDGGRACECPECKKIGASNLLMQLMGEVIERLSASAPNVEVETVGGYGPMDDPPTDAKIHPRQRVVWAHWGRYYDCGYGDPKYGKRNNLEAWRKAARGGITLCQYYTDNFAEPWVLPPFALSLIGDRKYFLDNGIDSVYMLMWPPGYWWNHALNGYMSGLCFYDVSLNPFEVIRDYGRQYFGPQAGPLLAAYYTQWAREIDLAYRVKDDAQDVHRAMLARQRKEWIDPAVKAASEDPVLSYRVAKVEKLHTLAERLAEMHRQKQEIRKLRAAGDFAAAGKELDTARSYTDDVLKTFTDLAELDQGLMDRNEVPSFIKMGVKNWIDDEAKAIAASKRD